MTPNILMVTAPFYRDIADALLQGARAALAEAGAVVEEVEVPGALEIPAAIGMGVATQRFDGFVALGCVIRGETPHFDLVCKESAEGLSRLALDYQLALGNGILTVENRAQAQARCGGDHGHKGADAARACLQMLMLKHQLLKRESLNDA